MNDTSAEQNGGNASADQNPYYGENNSSNTSYNPATPSSVPQYQYQAGTPSSENRAQPTPQQPGETQNSVSSLPPLPGSGASQSGSVPQFQYSAPQPEQSNVPPQYAASQPTTSQPTTSQPSAQGGAPAFPAGNPGQPPYGAPNPNNSAPAAAVPLNRPYYGCPPIEAVKRFFLNYVRFSGRASRSEFWWSYLFYVVVNIVIMIIDRGVLHETNSFLDSIWALAVLVPWIAISIRRLHDSGKSGWWILLPGGLTVAGFIVFAFIAITAGLGVSSVMGSSMNAMGAVSAGAAGGVVLGAIIFLLCLLAGFIIGLIFMVQGPKPEGARFDEPIAQAAPASGQFTQPMNQEAAAGNQYGQQFAQQPVQQHPFNAQNPQYGNSVNPANSPYLQETNRQNVANADEQYQQPANPQETAGSQFGQPSSQNQDSFGWIGQQNQQGQQPDNGFGTENGVGNDNGSAQ
ncbi:DUF805 domain-containing protein [Bifidobacterium sp. ESL0704]|uniref:DUF805 domain-containing protein n=1 Tax=Bifidobacterium sp. ESL0704 TaxID=2983219 RepID=UPI0023F6D0A7|nr:DUF805 domain-containing protein [Bifidobacterium sp. ESL0704]WEV53144.1 DUF805 domain-containing protein [Bifidobacterium sp. ESL0704]